MVYDYDREEDKRLLTHRHVRTVLKPFIDFLCIVLHVDPHTRDRADVGGEGEKVGLALLLELRARRLDLADFILQIADLVLLGALLVEQDCRCQSRSSENSGAERVS